MSNTATRSANAVAMENVNVASSPAVNNTATTGR
jgi:hypothetical protein